MTNYYGSLFQIRDLNDSGSAKPLQRVELTGSKATSGYDEAWLQRFLASHPQALPIAEIEAYMEGAVPVCLELGTKAGWIDLLLVTPKGDVILVECKLWRNPEARREVIGQIIDYAKELASLSYEALDDLVRNKAQPAPGMSKEDSLYQRSGAAAAGIDERVFVDAVSRNLRRSRLLLLVVGDGIQEGVQNIVGFLQQHAGLHFTLALVEVAIYRAEGDGYLVQPRVLAQTQMVSRGVVAVEDGRIVFRPEPAGKDQSGTAASPGKAPSVLATISEEHLYERLGASIENGASRMHSLVAALEPVGGFTHLTPTMIVLRANVGDRSLTLAKVDVTTGLVWFDGVVPEAIALGCRDAALAYYGKLASLVRDEGLRAKKLEPATKSGTASLPVEDLLSQPEKWVEAATAYLEAIAAATQASS